MQSEYARFVTNCSRLLVFVQVDYLYGVVFGITRLHDISFQASLFPHLV